VRIPKIINTEVEEAKSEIASDIIQVENVLSCKNIGSPTSCLLRTTRNSECCRGHNCDDQRIKPNLD